MQFFSKWRRGRDTCRVGRLERTPCMVVEPADAAARARNASAFVCVRELFAQLPYFPHQAMAASVTDVIPLLDQRGEFVTLDDGYVYWWPRRNAGGGGAITASELRVIADEFWISVTLPGINRCAQSFGNWRTMCWSRNSARRSAGERKCPPRQSYLRGPSRVIPARAPQGRRAIPCATARLYDASTA